MVKIKLFSDSSLDLPANLLEATNVVRIPMNVMMGEKSYTDLVDITPEQILDYGEKYKETPKTSSPTYERFSKALSSLEDYELAIIVLISERSSSGTHLVAKATVEDLGLQERAFIINTKSVSSGVGLMILEAKRLIDQGLGVQEIVKLLNEKVNRLETSFVIDKLDYLFYGGRCSQLSLMFSRGLKIRPCIEMVDGEMKATRKYRGPLLKVYDKYLEDLKSKMDMIDKEILAIAHTRMDDEEVLSYFLDKVRELNYFNEIIVADTSSTITAHAGPNTLGMFYFMKER